MLHSTIKRHRLLSAKQLHILVGASLVSLLAASIPLASWAVSATDLVNSVEKAKILSTGTRVSAAINGAEAYVSTYKNARATDNDCKIEAVLIAKTAMDLAPNDITRVTVYFYSTANVSKRKFITVTAGDVKAFGSGQVGQEQLLSSLSVKDEEVSDPAARLSSSLQQRETLRNKRSFDTHLNGQTMVVVADIDPGLNERDLKYEAFKIAEKALDAGAGQANKVSISFNDPVSRGTVQQIDFDASTIKAIDSKIQSALTSIQMAAVASRVDVQNLSVVDGDEKESRQKLLDTLKNLDKQGVGVGPFVNSFFVIEKMAAGDDTSQLKPSIERLQSALTEQEARSKNAKDFKPGGAAKESATKAADIPKGPPVEKPTKTSRWASGGSAMTDAEILTDPEKAVASQAAVLGGERQAEDNPKFALVLYHCYEVLNNNNRTADAQKFMRRYTELKARHHW